VVDKAIGSLLQERDVLRDNIFRTEERQLLSIAHHPSYVASTMPFLVPYNRTNISMYMFGLPSEYSYRTAKLLFYILAEISIYIAFLNQDVRKIIEEKSDDPLQEAVECGRIHLGIMALFLLENWDAPIFKESPQLKRFMKSLPDDDA